MGEKESHHLVSQLWESRPVGWELSHGASNGLGRRRQDQGNWLLQEVVGSMRKPRATVPGFVWAHLLHATPSHSGKGVGHQPGTQASEQPYLTIHLHNVLGCKKTEVVEELHPVQGHPLLGHTHPDQAQLVPQVTADYRHRREHLSRT